MPSIPSLLDQVADDYPTIRFQAGDDFLWNPGDCVIVYDLNSAHLSERLLHELSHAELEHAVYDSDIELIGLERDAWHHAKSVLAPRYGQRIATDVIEDDLDTYRDWLHARSLCPHCQQNGLQTAERQYTCLVCQTTWSVNQAIGCALRRYIKSNAS